MDNIPQCNYSDGVERLSSHHDNHRVPQYALAHEHASMAPMQLTTFIEQQGYRQTSTPHYLDNGIFPLSGGAGKVAPIENFNAITNHLVPQSVKVSPTLDGSALSTQKRVAHASLSSRAIKRNKNQPLAQISISSTSMGLPVLHPTQLANQQMSIPHLLTAAPQFTPTCFWTGQQLEYRLHEAPRTSSSVNPAQDTPVSLQIAVEQQRKEAQARLRNVYDLEEDPLARTESRCRVADYFRRNNIPDVSDDEMEIWISLDMDIGKLPQFVPYGRGNVLVTDKDTLSNGLLENRSGQNVNVEETIGKYELTTLAYFLQKKIRSSIYMEEREGGVMKNLSNLPPEMVAAARLPKFYQAIAATLLTGSSTCVDYARLLALRLAFRHAALIKQGKMKIEYAGNLSVKGISVDHIYCVVAYAGHRIALEPWIDRNEPRFEEHSVYDTPSYKVGAFPEHADSDLNDLSNCIDQASALIEEVMQSPNFKKRLRNSRTHIRNAQHANKYTLTSPLRGFFVSREINLENPNIRLSPSRRRSILSPTKSSLVGVMRDCNGNGQSAARITGLSAEAREQALAIPDPAVRDACLKPDHVARLKNIAETGLTWVSDEKLVEKLPDWISLLPDLNQLPTLQKRVLERLETGCRRTPHANADALLKALIRNWPALLATSWDINEKILDIADEIFPKIDEEKLGGLLVMFMDNAFEIAEDAPAVLDRALVIVQDAQSRMIDPLSREQLFEKLLQSMSVSTQSLGSVLAAILTHSEDDAVIERWPRLLRYFPALQQQCPTAMDEILHAMETAVMNDDMDGIGIMEWALDDLMEWLPAILPAAPTLQDRLSAIAETMLDQICPRNGEVRHRHAEQILKLRLWRHEEEN